jgi:hypothetical protein
MNRIILIAMLCFLVVFSASAKDKTPATATVAVDCSKGQSITEALNQRADRLTIEISGICEEDVLISRTHVTLRGTDPLTDGIRPAPDGPKRQALNVVGVNNINIESLSLSGADIGLAINASFGVFVDNCLIEDESLAGVIAGTASGSINLRDTEITSTAIPVPNRGIWATNGSSMFCSGCTISNHERGILLRHGSEMLLEDSTVVGTERGVEVVGGSRFVSFDGTSSSTIEGGSGGSQEALQLRDNSSALLTNGNINGRIRVVRNSVATLEGTSQLNPSLWNVVSSGSSLVGRDSASLDGDFNITEFSDVTLPLGSSTSGSLFCSLGAAAFCDNPSNATDRSDCGQCLNP